MEYADVAAAATGLEKDGVKPTVLLVRAKLGKGSLRDITPLLKRWKAERKGQRSGNRRTAGAYCPSYRRNHCPGTSNSYPSHAGGTGGGNKRTRRTGGSTGNKRGRDKRNRSIVERRKERAAGFAGQVESLKELVAKLEAERDAERERRITAERAQAAAEARIEEIRAATTQKATPKTTRKKQENLPL